MPDVESEIVEGKASFLTTVAKSAKRLGNGFWKLMSRPQYLVVIIGFVFGVLILTLTPPFQACDEPNHIYNAFRISEGHVMPPQRMGSWGNYVPRGFITTYRQLNSQSMACSLDGKVTLAQIEDTFKIPLDQGYRPFVASYIQYPPVCYIPQALGMAAGRLFGGSPSLLIYLARFFNLLAVLAIAFFTIRITPILKWAFFLLFLLPMALFQASSASADAMTIALSFLVTAYFFKLAFDPKKEKIERRDYYVLFAFAIVLGLIKLPYFLVLFGFFLIPREKFGGLGKWLGTFAGMLAIAAVIGLGWQFVLLRPPADARPATIIPSQLAAEMLRHPLAFVRLEWHRLIERAFYLKEMVGGVGWYNVLVPWWLTPAVLITLAGTALLDKEEEIGVRNWRKLVSMAVFLGVSAAVMIIVHITMDPLRATASTAKDYLMGRYFLPPLALAVLVFYNRKIKFTKGKPYHVAVTALSLLFCLTTIFMITGRFW